MGDINVFSGPMKCGKSQRLIVEANRLKVAGKNIKVFKPLMDKRFSEDNIADRNGNKFPAINIEKIDEIEKYDADIYLIDEFQFLDGNIDSIQKLANKIFANPPIYSIVASKDTLEANKEYFEKLQQA